MKKLWFRLTNNCAKAAASWLFLMERFYQMDSIESRVSKVWKYKRIYTQKERLKSLIKGILYDFLRRISACIMANLSSRRSQRFFLKPTCTHIVAASSVDPHCCTGFCKWIACLSYARIIQYWAAHRDLSRSGWRGCVGWERLPLLVASGRTGNQFKDSPYSSD